MKEEITRIARLVREGKLSPEDAAELIEAMSDAPGENGTAEPAAEAPPPGEGGKANGHDKDAFAKLIGTIERIGKDVAQNVDWEQIGQQIRQGVNKGVEAVRAAAEDARKSGGLGSLFASAKTKTVELPVSVPAGKTLRVVNPSGDVRIEGGHDVGSMTATATFRAPDEAQAAQMAERYVPILEEGDDFVLLRQPDMAGLNVDVVFRVPAGTPTDVKVDSGDTLVQGTKAACRIDGSSGDVHVRDVDGSVEVTVRSGDVLLADARGGLVNVDVKSGDIRLELVSGTINVRCASGDVSGSEVFAQGLTIELASGDVHFDIAKPLTGNASVRTVSGDVSLTLPDGCDCRVQLSTLRGGVNTNLEMHDKVKERQRLTGVLGQGGGLLEASAVNGDVSVNQRYTFARED